jgi:hypothetical protein
MTRKHLKALKEGELSQSVSIPERQSGAYPITP